MRQKVTGSPLHLALVGLGLAAVFGAASSGALARPSERGVVDIYAIGYQHAATAGTGLVVTPGGEVLTNNHVIRGAVSVRVVEPASGRAYAATVVGYDLSTDIAVLALHGASNLPTVALGNSSSVRLGESVTAIGNAGGFGGAPRVTRGRVVGIDRSLKVAEDDGGFQQLHALIHASALLVPGESGGPLVDAAGKVIGLDTAAAFPPHRHASTPGEAFSIPIDQVLAISRRIESGRRSDSVHIGPTPFIGVDVELEQPLPAAGKAQSTRGALVKSVVASSPAQRAGLGHGDLITMLDGRRITSFGAIAGVVVGLAPGVTIGVGWLAPSGAAHQARMRLASGPPQ
jgi:S1-C subfamily serine protease